MIEIIPGLNLNCLLILYSNCDPLNSQFELFYFCILVKNKSIFELREISCDKWSLLSAVLDKK